MAPTIPAQYHDGMPDSEEYAKLVAELRGQEPGAVFNPVDLMTRAADAIEHLANLHKSA